MKAMWNGIVLAESDDTIEIEGNHYFPPGAVQMDYLRETTRRSTCPWKGEAHYFDIVVREEANKAAAWTYPHPKEAAKQITGYVAFWKGVDVS